MTVNRQIVLAARPVGMPKESDFRVEESPMPSPGPGEFLFRTRWLSVDPYMRGRISGMKSYAKGVDPGDVMVGGTVGEVVESNHPAYKAGDWLVGYMGWREYAVSDGRDAYKIDPAAAPPSLHLGVLGMPGLTAYFGLLDVCAPKAGETVFCSGGAGAVGGVVGQIAKLKGCRVVGSAGSDDKVAFMKSDLGYDSAFNYRTCGDYRKALAEHCPKGIDCYFDNVGGEITDAAILALNVHARVAICGQIALYNATAPELGPRLLTNLIVTRSKIQGLLVSDYLPRFPEGIAALTGWWKEGKLTAKEDVVEGLENAPAAFIGVLQGKNFGKMLVKVA